MERVLVRLFTCGFLLNIVWIDCCVFVVYCGFGVCFGLLNCGCWYLHVVECVSFVMLGLGSLFACLLSS